MLPRILLADDDAALCVIGEAELSLRGYPVETAANGAEALDRLMTESFDVLVTDLEMPGMDGLELVRRLRASDCKNCKKSAEMPVVMLTGRDDDEAINAAFEVGATTFLQKPVNWLSLIHHLNFVLRADQAKRNIAEARDQAEKNATMRENLMLLLRHELKTPLHLIMGYSDLVSDAETLQPAVLKDSVDNIRAAANDMNDRLSKVFFLADLRNGALSLSPQPTNLRDVVDSARIMAESALTAKDIDLQVRIERDLEVNADFKAIIKAINELIANAAAASPSGGVVTVAAERVGSDGVTLTVIDDGEGFSDHALDTALETFSQKDSGLQRTSEGLGLGLAVVAEIMTRQGGNVVLENHERGACITLHFRSGDVSSSHMAITDQIVNRHPKGGLSRV